MSTLILILSVLISSESFSQNKTIDPSRYRFGPKKQPKAVLPQKKTPLSLRPTQQTKVDFPQKKAINNNTEYLTDQSGNRYKTIKIGNNVWMAENFKAKHYSNGDPIEEYNLEIDDLGNVYPDFDGNNPFFSVLKYGNYVYSGGAILDPRGIAPNGWHLPSQADWEELGAVSNSSNDFKSISGWSPSIIPGYYPRVDCPICKNWNSEYRSNKRGCDRCQDTRTIEGKYIPKKIIYINGNNRLKFNLKDVGYIEERLLITGENLSSTGAYWTSDEDNSYDEGGAMVCLVLPPKWTIWRSEANDFPKFVNFRKKLYLLPVRLVKNKE